MTAPAQSDNARMMPHSAIPHDVKRAVDLMRSALCRPVSMTDLARRCGVAERTLNQHFRTFFDVSPMRFLRQMRLSAARQELLSGDAGISVTAVARRYEFQHVGRFAAQYRSLFGEPPSRTLRRARATPPEPRDQGHRLPSASRDKPTIAILPCRTPAHEPSLRWMAESLAESLAAAACTSPLLAVAAPKAHHSANQDRSRVARDLNVRYLLTGRLERDDERLRAILCVIDSVTGQYVWGDCLDGTADQPLSFQNAIVKRVISALTPGIRCAEIERARRTEPRSLDAYGLAMRALPLVFASRPDSARRALELLERAMESDPDYGLPPALASWCHGQLIMFNGTLDPAEQKRRAVGLLRRAAILEDDEPLALTARGAVHTMARDFDAAQALVTRALALDPSCGWTWGRSGWLHSYLGNAEVAIDHFGRSLSLAPTAAMRVNSFVGIGSAHFNAERYADVIQWLERALVEQPGAWWVNRSLSVSYARLGHRAEALQSLDRLRRSCPDLTVDRVVSAVPFRADFLDRLGEGLSELGLPA